MTWNVNGWTEHNQIVRQSIIEHLCPDILCIGETHLEGTQTISIDNYEFIGHNRQHKHIKAPKIHGGVGMLIKSELYNKFNIFIIDKCMEGILGVKFTHKLIEYSIVVYACYLAPYDSPYGRNQTEYLGHLIAQMYMQSESDQTYICGDFNGRIGELSDTVDGIDMLPRRCALDKTVHGHGEALIGFMQDAKLCVLNGRLNPENDNYTCISTKGASVVDYIMVPHDVYFKCTKFNVYTMADLVDKYNLIPLLGNRCKLPDHSILHTEFCITSTVNETECSEEMIENTNSHDSEFNMYYSKKYRFKNVPDLFMSSESWKSGVIELIDYFVNVRKNQDEIDKGYGEFCKLLLGEMDGYLKYSDASKRVRKRFKNHKPFWNQRLTELWNVVRKEERKYLKFNGPRHIKSQFRQDYISARDNFDKSLRRAEREYNAKIVTDIENVSTENPREFWNFVKRLGPKRSSQIPLKVYDNGMLTCDLKVVLDQWKSETHDLYNKPPENEIDDFYRNIMISKEAREAAMENSEYEENPELNRPLSFDEIEYVVNKLKQNKATGLDNIPNEVLKNHDVMQMLYNLFRKCFEFGIIPSVWLKAIITPIPKSSSKDPYIPLNYRGISLLSCVCKVFSGIINRRVMNYCELADLLVDEQNGFRKNRSCIDHVFTLSSIIRNRISQNQGTFACFIDMQKAFDWVDRDLLFYKLLEYNIDGKLYNCIKALYNHPLSTVKLNSYMTDWFTTESGVRQGDSLSPTAFAIFINDLAKEMKDLNVGVDIDGEKICILLFADDIVILAENETDLQTLLNFVDSWCKNWRMKINIDKTKVVHFRTKRQRKTNQIFYMSNNVIDIVPNYKYLGVIFDEFLDFNAAADTLSGAAGRALGGIISKFKMLKNVGFNSFSKLYHSGVVPVMDYCAGIWGYKNFDSCNRIQQRALRYYLGVHQKAPLLALEGDTGWVNSTIRRHTEMVRFWNRVLGMDSNRLTRKIFEYDYARAHNHNNWSYELKQIFTKYGHANTFVRKVQCDTKSLRCINEDVWKSNWLNQIPNKPKLRRYALFKSEYSTEDYVKSCSHRVKRSLLAQIRFGILPLHIETGRFKATKLEDRKCMICNSNEIEDEFHFTCICKEYSEYRDHMYECIRGKNVMFDNMTEADKFVYIMKYEWQLYSNFLYNSWMKRNRIMYR